MDVVKMKVWVPDAQALRAVLGAARVSLDCGAPRGDANGFAITVYGPKAEADKIAALGYRYERDDKFGDTLAARQAQVSKTDRFAGGTIKPVGLGVKR